MSSALVSIRIDGRLRFPQLEAVESFADAVLRAGRTFGGEAEKIALAFREFAGHRPAQTPWHEVDIALATGVGKTRLAGALIELLMMSGLSESILVLSHRRLLFRRWADVLNVQSPETVVPLLRNHSKLATLSSFVDWRGTSRGSALIVTQTVQALASELERTWPPMHQMDVLDELSSRDDLVVIFDESHHLRSATHSQGAGSWVQTIAQLSPKLVIGLTATPRRERHVLYEYDLKRLLADGIFSKSLTFVVSEPQGDSATSSEEELTVARALALLDQKRLAAEALPLGNPMRNWRPALLLLVPRVAEIDQVKGILTNRLKVNPSRVLTVAGSTVTDKELEVLRDFDSNEHLERDIVVSAFMLDEGWDVKRVSVIAPLRNLASIQNATQVVGRGLRLPAGHRIGHALLDALHVLVSGQQSLLEIRDQVRSAFGEYGADIVIEPTGAHHTGAVIAREDDPRGPFSAYQALRIRLRRLHQPDVRIPVLVPARMTVRIPKHWSIESLDERLSAVDALDASLSQIELDRSPLETDEAVRAVVNDGSFLTRGDVRAALKAWCDAHGKVVPPTMGVPQLKRISRDLLGGSHFDYVSVRDAHEFPLEVDYRCFGPTDDVRRQDGKEPWQPRQWYSTWTKSLYDVARFDSHPEFVAAQMLDGIASVNCWLRNDPRLFRIQLPTGLYSPDFVIWLPDEVLFLEVKGRNLVSDFNEAGRTESLRRFVTALRALETRADFVLIPDDDLEGSILRLVGGRPAR